MKSQIAEWCPDIAGVADVALCESTIDHIGGAPDCEVRFAAVGMRFLDGRAFEVWNASHSRKLTQDVSAIATCMAGDEDAPITLADRQ